MSFHDEEVLGKAYDARLMRRLLGFLRPYKLQVVIALAAISGASLLQLAQPYLMKIVIDDHIALGQFEGMGRLALLFLAILTGSFALDYIQTYTLQMTGQRIMFDLRMRIFDQLQRIDLAFYDRNPVGRLMTRVTTDVDVLNDLFTSGVVSAVGDAFKLVGIMVMLVVMDWRLALVAFSVLPLILVVTQWFRRNVRESYRTVRTWIARINAFLQENITGMATVQLFRRESENFARFDAVNCQHRDANVESIFYYAVFYPAIEVISALAAALILWFGGGRTLNGTVTLGTLVAFLQYSQRFFQPISDMSEKFNTLQSAMASSERIFKLLDTPVGIASPAGSAIRRAQSGRIVFDHVWFSYRTADSAPSILRQISGSTVSHVELSRDAGLRPADRSGTPESADEAVGQTVDARGALVDPADEYVLRDVSFEVEPGQRVGIVGATGAGKTTLISLLLRFYDVSRGRILIDGVDVRNMDLNELRGLYSLVLQDVHLFSGTIAGNIRLGRTDIDDEQVRRAAAAVHADPFITALPQGYDSPVAERGATLSVGQKQLLSFARALAFDPRILVLDEATSSVDTETELLIRDALHVLMAGRTTLAVAHRLSTIQDMDKILVFHHGQLREMGSHQDLLGQRGIYFKLFQLQYKSGENDRIPNAEDRRRNAEHQLTSDQ
jgi:ATP-binding cassette, subfamily B, multidrug efflux pump